MWKWIKPECGHIEPTHRLVWSLPPAGRSEKGILRRLEADDHGLVENVQPRCSTCGNFVYQALYTELDALILEDGSLEWPFTVEVILDDPLDGAG